MEVEKQKEEITDAEELKGGACPRKRIHSDSDDSRNPKRPAPEEELIFKKMKDLEDKLLKVKQELHALREEFLSVKQELHQLKTSQPEKNEEFQQKVEKQEHVLFCEEVTRTIFKNLNFNDLCRAACVCKEWNKISRHLDFRKKIIVNWTTGNAALKCIEMLTSCTTHITQVNFADDTDDKMLIDLDKFLMKIKQQCPNLHTLILNGIAFDVCGEIFNIFIQLPKTVRVFVLHDSYIFRSEQNFEISHDQDSMLKVLDLSTCNQVFMLSLTFSRMPSLEHLRLAGCLPGYLDQSNIVDEICSPGSTHIDDYFVLVVRVLCEQLIVLDLELTGIGSATFRTIFSSCSKLKEVYLCFSKVQDSDLISIANSEIVASGLKIICLRNCFRVTDEGIEALIRAVPSLTDVYVGSKDDNLGNYDSDRFPEQVHVINDIKHCKHHKKVNYCNISVE